jgi:hypothetical protein
MLNMKWTMSAVMLAGAFVGIAPRASAQAQNYRGAFNLPFEARFGNKVLPAGDYKVSTIDGAKGVRITGDQASVSILSTGYDLKAEDDKPKMVFVERDGVFALQSFESGLMGKALYFYVGKGHNGTTERAGAKPAVVEVGMQ